MTDAHPRNEAAWRRGWWIAAVGLAGFLPSVAIAVFSSSYQMYAALSTLGCFVVWKIGRTMMKLNSGES